MNNISGDDSGDDETVQFVGSTMPPATETIITSNPHIHDLSATTNFYALSADPFVSSGSFLHFYVRGKPQSKLRAARGANGNIYNPSRDKEVEFADVVANLIQHHRGAPVHFGIAAFTINCKFMFATTAGNGTVMNKPDIDNLAKFVLDALTDVLFDDDRQAVTLKAKKEMDEGYGGTGYTVVTFDQA